MDYISVKEAAQKFQLLKDEYKSFAKQIELMDVLW